VVAQEQLLQVEGKDTGRNNNCQAPVLVEGLGLELELGLELGLAQALVVVVVVEGLVPVPMPGLELGLGQHVAADTV